MDVNNVLNLTIDNPTWLYMEYDIVQHCLCDENDKCYASFMVTYSNEYKIKFISIHQYGIIDSGTEELIIKHENGTKMMKHIGEEYIPASPDILKFYQIFEKYFLEIVDSY